MSDRLHPAVKDGTYDVGRVRADFPILSREVYGKPLVYLDNAASAQKPREPWHWVYRCCSVNIAQIGRAR